MPAAVQGIGGGGIINLASIITSDLVPLAERGLYQGLLVLTWAFAAAIGPVIVRVWRAVCARSLADMGYLRAVHSLRKRRGGGFSVSLVLICLFANVVPCAVGSAR